MWHVYPQAQRNLFWNTDRKGLQSSVRLWRRPYYRGRDCINSSFSGTKQAVRNIEVSLINVAVRKEVILRSTSCITSVHKRYILLVEKGYRSRHFLYFEHDRKGAYYLPEIPYVEEYVEEPFLTSCWGNFTLTKWCKLMKITDYVDWTSGLFKKFRNLFAHAYEYCRSRGLGTTIMAACTSWEEV